MKKLIKNGTIVLEDKVIQGDLLIEDEVIAEIGQNLDAEGGQIIDATGLVVLPGGIDVHTHFNIDVGVRAVDDFSTGTIAAAFGGTTTIVDHMGFGPKGCNLHHQLGVYKGYTNGKCVTDYGIHGVFQDINEDILKETEVMMADGVSSFKMYLTYDYKLEDADTLKVLKKLKDIGGITTVHCENDAIIHYLRDKFVAEGKTEAKYHPQSRPPYCEAEAVDRMIALAKAAGKAPLYIVHVSAKESVNLIREARKAGDTVFGETCPQYLVLDESRYDDPVEGLKFILSPPLRAKEHQEAIWQGIKDGTLQVIATDHCSFDFHGDKQNGKDDFTKCPNGAPGVETRMPIVFSEGVSKGRLSLNEFAAVTSTNPAKIFGMYPKKGVLAPGSDADIVLMNPDMEFLLYAVLPIKVKWLALLDAVYMVYQIINSLYLGFRTLAQGASAIYTTTAGAYFSIAIAIIVAMANFLIYFFATRQSPRARMHQKRRKRSFERQTNQYANGARHRCAVCGRTELDDDSLDFRYCSKCDGNYEYCSDHLFTHQHVKKFM